MLAPPTSPASYEAFHNIPEELKQLPNFVLWRLETTDTGKLTKVPYDVNGYKASVSNSRSWNTFDVCIKALPGSPANGIGFVISADANLVCIDLDDPYEKLATGELKHKDPEAIKLKQEAIAAFFSTYQEISPSGNGLHIWLKGSIPTGRRQGGIEAYPSGRFMTMTGAVYNSSPIQAYPEELHQLWEELGPAGPIMPAYLPTDPEPELETLSDADIVSVASGAANGMKFADLWAGNWQTHYPSQSEADFGLIDMIAFYTDSRFQVTRMFRNSGLGQRKKALRANYTEPMISRSFDRKPPPINLDMLKLTLDSQFEALKSVKVNEENGKVEKTTEISAPDGLIGDIARFIYDAAPRPVPEIALVGALGLMAGICGRCYNISGTGLNQYLLLLANTGTGKEACASGIDKLIAEVRFSVPDAVKFIGPGEISSPQALIKYLAKESTSFVSIIGEFATPLKRMTGINADGNQAGLRKVYRDLYGKSGQGSSAKPIIYSERDKNTSIIESPSFSIVGESNPDEIYNLMSHQLITDGLLPRFTIIEYSGHRPMLNKSAWTVKPSERLIERLAGLCAHSCQLNNTNSCIDVQLSDEAKQLMDKFNLKCDLEHRRSENETTRHLWTRGYLKAMKLAGLLAVGTNYIIPVVSESQARWAIELCEGDIVNLLKKFDSGEVGEPQVQSEQLKDLKRAVGKYCKDPWAKIKGFPGATEKTHEFHCIPHGYLTSYCSKRLSFKSDRNGHIQAVNHILGSLIAAGDIQEIGVDEKVKKGIGKNGKCYAVIDLKGFL